MQLSVTGTIIKIGTPVTNVSKKDASKSFTTQVVYIEEPGKYPNYYKLECNEKSMPYLEKLRVGELVTAKFNLKGFKYENRDTGNDVFIKLECFNIFSSEYNATATVPQPTSNNNGSDLPF